MNYYADERSTDYLAHYGVKGMRWGVRRAIATENQRALDRHYRKAAKKLAKLQDIGVNSKKYAAKSAAYGAAAAGVGTLAAKGTDFIGDTLNQAGAAISSATAKPNAYGIKVIENWYGSIGRPVKDWGQKGIGKYRKVKSDTVIYKHKNGKKVYGNKLVPITNNDLYRAGMGIATAGLVAKSAQNAYRAANGKKYRSKAVQWKQEMDAAFAGTPYEGHYEKPRRRKRK